MIKKEKYNKECKNYCENSDGSYCYIDADMAYCTKNYAWASNGIGEPFPVYETPVRIKREYRSHE